MKKLFVILCLIFAISCVQVYAENGSYVTAIDNTTYYRVGPGTNYNSINQLVKGNSYTLIENNIVPDEGKNGKCNSGWYHIAVGEGRYYVCSEWVAPTIIEKQEEIKEEDYSGLTCEETMIKKGFPLDYIGSLCQLKANHPRWDFIAVQVNATFEDAVTRESACGKSYIASTKAENIDSSCVNAYKKTWYPASKTAVAYYMDPRNWLTEKYIFQFNTNKYESSLKTYYPVLVKDTIDGADFYKFHITIGNDLANIISVAGEQTNISPTFLASRMLQELGSGTSERELYSGTVAGYEGLYNFYNIGVSDSCATTSGTTACGLTYARNAGWTSPLAAIVGGSNLVSASYVNAGQYTTYFQKFNVVPINSSKIFTHQYMTNIGAPSSESTTAYSTYNRLGVLDAGFVFYIPVYLDMGANINNSGAGASGEGANSDKSDMSISTIVTSAGYRFQTSYITAINPNTLVSDVKGSIESIAGASNVHVYNHDGHEVSDGTIGTGYKVSVSNKTVTSTLTVVIRGDTSGDGIINTLDLLQVQKSILGISELEGNYLAAADTSGDGVVNALDLLQVQKNILGIDKITQ